MREIKISSAESGVKLIRYLQKYMDEASSSFLYKMLRKKNIKLNNQKAEGTEVLKDGDLICIYMLDESIANFQSEGRKAMMNSMNHQTSEDMRTTFDGTLSIDGGKVIPEIVYEDERFVFFNKPSGVLSQKAQPTDYSMNEYLIDYCKAKKEEKDGNISVPSICNRLDRNTSGLLLCAKNMSAASALNGVIMSHQVEKYYLTLVKGAMNKTMDLTGFIGKDTSHNKAVIFDHEVEGAKPMHTIFTPLCTNGEYTLVKAQLISGKSHQIRAHLHSIGMPVVGDGKYGDKRTNQYFKKQYKLKHHLLHAQCIRFDADAKVLANQTFVGNVPAEFLEILYDLMPEAKQVLR